MRHYIALIHKEAGSSYGVSFPDVPGVITAAETLDDALAGAAEVLAFAAEDWAELTGHAFPPPRSLDELRRDPRFLTDASEAIVAAVHLERAVERAA